MRLVLILSTLSFCTASPQQLDEDIVKDIFGDVTRAGYGEGEAPKAAQVQEAKEYIGAVVQIVKETKPADYVEPDNNNLDKANVEINAQFSTCAEYTPGFGYECVPYYQCANGTIITDGAGLIDIRGGFGNLAPEESKCPGFLDVCCKDPDFIPPPPPRVIHKPACGRRNVGGLGARIQGFKDSESQFGEWPHMCAVLHEKPVAGSSPQNLYKCGGSLISPGVILTAAHCVKDFLGTPSQLKIRCGEWDTQKQSEPYPHQDRYGAAVKIHPEFNPKNLANDFALIFLQEEFQLDFHVDTICLPKPDESYDFESCFATGWGKDNFGIEGKYQVVLKEIDLNVFNNAVCEEKLRKTRLGQKFKLDESFICAGGLPGKDTCKGDGGSPLVCPRKSDPTRYDQAGIVAWGIGCGEEGVPGVYAGVSKAVCWIDYAMTCYYGKKSGDYASFWGNDQKQCGVWFDGKLKELDVKAEAAGTRLSAVFETMKSAYKECQVKWLTANGEADGGYNQATDLEVFQRVGTPSNSS